MSAYNKNYFNIVKELLNGTLTRKTKKKENWNKGCKNKWKAYVYYE